MNKSEENTCESLSYHYKETVRLADVCDSYVKEAFADFKLLAAIGGILTWKPIHDTLNLGQPCGTVDASDKSILFLGFVAFLLIIVIVGIMNLQKQLIINFYLGQLQYFESEIRSLLGREEMASFRVAEHWRKLAYSKQRILGFIFYVLFYVAAGAPVLMLDFHAPKYYGAKYLALAVAVIMMHIGAVFIVHRKVKSNRRKNRYNSFCAKNS